MTKVKSPNRQLIKLIWKHTSRRKTYHTYNERGRHLKKM